MNGMCDFVKGKCFTVKGITVECKDEVKLLGVYIDSQLTFSKQISFICQKAGSYVIYISSFYPK